MNAIENTALVALMNNKLDFAIAQHKQWYRIPVKSAPSIIRENNLKTIAFYQTKEFGEKAFAVRWFAEVKNVEIVVRKDLFPNEPENAKSNKEYYKICFEALKELKYPIPSLRPRRILFIPTTEEKLFSAREINYLYNTSPLEEKMWTELVNEKINAERQYYVETRTDTYILDFAIFCKTRNIDLECDGDAYHLAEERVKSDKKRNNLLEKDGWAVLRFHSDDIHRDMNNSISIVKDTINKYGGVADPSDPHQFHYLDSKNDNQTRLFM